MAKINNKGQFKYGNKIAEIWSDIFVFKELNKMIDFLEKDNINDTNILSISMLLIASKSSIKTEKQFDYLKSRFRDNDAVSGSFEMIKDMIKNRWILNGAKNKLNSNIAKLVLINNYQFGEKHVEKEDVITGINIIFSKDSNIVDKEIVC